MTDKLTISKERPSVKSMDYSFLRDEGLKHIENLGSKIWTDYNVHDPGITIMEALCYAITDLGYRTSFDIEDLLAEPQKNDTKLQFFTARDVLTCNPVTENDFRKIIIDADKVRNAWVTLAKHSEQRIYSNCSESKLEYTGGTPGDPKPMVKLRGLYDILLELDDAIDPSNTGEVEPVKSRVREKLHTVRNLCEDFLSIDVITIEKIGLCADIEVTPDAIVEDVLARIFFEVHQFISPSINFYSLKEMLDKGKRSEDIFDGPFLDNGFIDPDELEATELKRVIRVSDLYQIIMGVAGVQKIRKLLLFSFDENGIPNGPGEKWCLELSNGKSKPKLSTELSTVTFHKGLLPFNADKEKVLEKFELLKELSKRPAIDSADNNFEIPVGEYRELQEYTSIQEEFPLTYGIGPEGLPESAGDLRKAQAKQLKEYLMFYDQLLANYLAQLARVKDLLSVNNVEDATYFAQPLYDVPEVKELLKDYDGSDWETYKSDSDNGYNTKLKELLEDKSTKWDRRNRFLDHLIARFGERFSDYVLLMYTMYGNRAEEDIVYDKESFLADYPVVSRDRGKAFNYKAWHEEINKPDVWDTLNVSGLEARVARLLGVNDYRRRNLHCEPVYTLETYKLTSGSNAGKYKFRLRDTDTTILLESTQAYVLLSKAEENMALLGNYLLDEENYEIKKVSEPNKYRLFIKNDKGKNRARSKKIFNSNIEASALMKKIVYLACPEDCCENESCLHEGFHLVEHILLRPRNENYSLFPVTIKCDDCIEAVDPYSFRTSILIPCWPQRFQSWEFRQFVEETIRKEAPAHIALKICWISCLQMRKFEEAYKIWLEEMAKENPQKGKLKNYANNLIGILFSLRNVHPEAKLHDCKTGEDGLILGHTNLGQL